MNTARISLRTSFTPRRFTRHLSRLRVYQLAALYALKCILAPRLECKQPGLSCEAQCGIFLRWTAVEPLATDPSKGYFTGSAKDEMRRRVSKKKAQQSASASASAAARRTQRLKNFGKGGGNNRGREGRDLFSQNLQ